MPHLESYNRYEERHNKVKEVVLETLEKQEVRYSNQGDTYFTEKHKETLSPWGVVAYELIFMNKNSNFKAQLREKHEINSLEK